MIYEEQNKICYKQFVKQLDKNTTFHVEYQLI